MSYDKEISDLNSIRERMKLASLNESSRRAIAFSMESGQFIFFTSAQGLKIGYCAWLQVTRESIWRLCRTGKMPYHWHEWSEGKVTLLLDVFFDQKHAPEARRQFTSLMKGKKIISYRKNNKTTIKIRKNNNFFSTLFKK